MDISVQDALQLLIDSFPTGSKDIYDFDGNIGKFLTAIASGQKKYLYDPIQKLELESNPQTIVDKIPDWESACGLTQTRLAKLGTLAQRREQIISKLRQFSTFTFDDIRSVLQPFFKYADPTQIQIYEPDRVDLKNIHTYDAGTFSTNALSGFGQYFLNGDDNFLTVPLQLIFRSSVNLNSITLKLISPQEILLDIQRINIVANTDYVIWGTVSSSIFGTWVLQVTTSVDTDISWKLFVEGLGKDANGVEQSGSNMFAFTVVADTNLLGPGFDLLSATDALNRITPAHLQGYILVKTGSNLCAYPDLPTTLPDETIPC